MPTRVAFVYANARSELAAAVARGEAPDSTLLGQNHLAEHGLAARIHDPLLTRRVKSRLRWNARELVLPWELGNADVAFTPLANLFPLAARARRRPRVVIINFGLNLIARRSSRPRQRLLAGSLEASARIVCIAKSQRTELLELTGLAPEQVVAVLHAVDGDYFQPQPAPARERPLVLAVGKDLSRDYASLAVAVRGLPVDVEILALPKNLHGVDLPPNARARAVGPGELRSLYAAARIVVLPQRREDFLYGAETAGLTALLEAMLMRKPIVATERAALRDYITADKDALVVPAEEPDALRAALERLLADDELGERLAASAYDRAVPELTTRLFAARIAPIIADAAA